MFQANIGNERCLELTKGSRQNSEWHHERLIPVSLWTNRMAPFDINCFVCPCSRRESFRHRNPIGWNCSLRQLVLPIGFQLQNSTRVSQWNERTSKSCERWLKLVLKSSLLNCYMKYKFISRLLHRVKIIFAFLPKTYLLKSWISC